MADENPRGTALPLPSTSPLIRPASCEAPSSRREPASKTSWRNSPTSWTRSAWNARRRPTRVSWRRWHPTQKASGLDIRPHECRHVTHLRAAGINDADLAEIAGHRVETMLARYTHAVGESFEGVSLAIG